MSGNDPLIETDVEAYLRERGRRDLMRFITCGSVDDGKSTLIGRLLYDTQRIADDHLAELAVDSAAGGSDLDFALVTDGLKAEREQGITIDVAYRYFSTPRRNFIIADTPGHEQYTRNMATGASTADLAVILVDARKGVIEQTRRHSYIAALLGIKHFVLAVNKMDLIEYTQNDYLQIVADYREYSKGVDPLSLEFVPISALHGDNLVESSSRMPWFEGPTLIDHLDTVNFKRTTTTDGFRLPIQLVLRSSPDFRGYAGTITSGEIRPGDRVTALPSGVSSTVERIVGYNEDRPTASAGEAVAVTLSDEIDISRGDLMVGHGEKVQFGNLIDATVIWMSEGPLAAGQGLTLRSRQGTANVTVEDIRHLIDVNTQQEIPTRKLKLNDIAQCSISSDRKLLFESYAVNRSQGSFILIDRITNATVAAGMVSGLVSPWDRPPADLLKVQTSSVTAEERQLRYRQRPCTILLTGLTGAGKSTIATALERYLFDHGNSTVRLDGENVRLGISKDLGFSAEDRSENLRRVAEVARLMNNQGLIAIAALVAPQAGVRSRARQLVGGDRWVEVFLDTPIAVCRARDTSGIYEAAENGEIDEFPGVSAPYEAPEDADLRLDTSTMTVDQSVRAIIALLTERSFIDG
ncbi:MAG: sulfate adenylyltransferase subunit CysN [Actinomycetota bacterium]|jgi:bifunctional enzyme CysN/CysC|nr:sulfate adenylyltransferase subunit CysN [Acidimicrobiales bacterium]MEC8976054.1 sulfate adenylyltransferase subunit CysN [Actinomycetota bacterium]|tara:strand:- start:2407 stop:4317 length:1911 start_codon:yes stop_codon:yes gene_type:complete